MQTVSTVGYGDIRATTTPERLVSVFCMAYGASTWAYVVASVCGIVTSLDPHGTHRKHVSRVPACVAPLFAVQCMLLTRVCRRHSDDGGSERVYDDKVTA